VPLLYQQSACATFKAVLETAWRNYGIAQVRGALPAGPMVIFVHMASVWVPFTSESKEAIADYDEIRKEIKLALQECGRRLGVFLRRRERAKSEFRRRNIFELYIEEVVEACARLKGGKLPKDKLRSQLQKIATKRTGGTRTDEILSGDGGPDGLPHSIIVTAEGTEGETPDVSDAKPGDAERLEAPTEEPTEAPAVRKTKAVTRAPKAGARKTRGAKRNPEAKAARPGTR
jgi:DNA topoisomerase-6 subunit B